MLNHHHQQQQQQQLEQLELQQLSYTNQLQTLPGCNSTASSSSSPTCHSPSAGSGATALTNSAAATGHIALLNGGGSNGSDTDIPNSSAAATATVASAAAAAAAAAYHHHHQLTIIAPIVITPASMMNGSTAMQPIHASEAITTTTPTALNGLDHNLTQRPIASSQHHAAHLLSQTALAYAPNAATATYLISGSGGPTVLGGSGNTQGSIISNGISDHIMTNVNPLCSFSEVTNTLLNQ